MNRWQTIALGLLAGGALAVVVLLLAVSLRSCSSDDAAAADESTPVHLREDVSVPESAPRVRTQPVTVYQRAPQAELLLAPVSAQIVWIASPSARAREIVRLVLEGIPESNAGIPPAGPGLRCREVFIDAEGTAWVDLEIAGTELVRGSDEEQGLVAALARSLVEALEEVQRVGILVGGEPRRTLAGHVDLTRTYTGYEWRSVDDGLGAQAPGELPEDAAPELAGDLL